MSEWKLRQTATVTVEEAITTDNWPQKDHVIGTAESENVANE